MSNTPVASEQRAGPLRATATLWTDGRLAGARATADEPRAGLPPRPIARAVPWTVRRSARERPAGVLSSSGPQRGQNSTIGADQGASSRRLAPTGPRWAPDFANVARIADRQHGRVTWAQIVAAGVTPKQATAWCRDGILRREHRGVYAVGHGAPSRLGDLKAAELTGGADGAVSHACSGCLLRLIAVWPARPEITVPGLGGRRRPGIVIHRVRTLPALDLFVYRGIRTTAVPRTLLDLAPRLSLAGLTTACHEAWVHHRTTPHHIEACIARNPHKPGAAKLRRALGSDATLSALEDGFLELLARHDLPAPRTNTDHHGDKVDCHWPALGLTIELLGYRFHNSRKAFEDDVARRRRSAHHAFAWGDVFERAAATAHEVAALLTRRA